MKLITSTITYLKEVRSELKRVNWPRRQETLRFTAAVIMVSAAVGIFLGSLDYIFYRILQFFINR